MKERDMNLEAEITARLRGTPLAFKEKCSSCQAPSLRPGLCIDCETKQRRKRDAIVATQRSIPLRFSWARSLDVPELATRVDLAALDQAKAIDPWSLDRVTMMGPAGSGKTSLAIALTNAYVHAVGGSAVFMAAVDLGVARQQAGLGMGEAEPVRRAMKADLLVLDDLGQEVDAGSAAVAHVIAHRYDASDPTIATTGFAVEQLVARYGAGVVRRLVEASGGAVLLKLRSRGERSGR